MIIRPQEHRAENETKQDQSDLVVSTKLKM